MYARQAASEWTSKVRGGYEGRSGRDCGRGYGVAEGLCTYVCRRRLPVGVGGWGCWVAMNERAGVVAVYVGYS